MFHRLLDVLIAGRSRFATSTAHDSVLAEACRINDIGTVRRLLWRGADVSHSHSLALGQAAAEGHEEIVALLLRCGAGGSAKSSVLAGAIYNNHLVVVQRLLAHKSIDRSGLNWAMWKAVGRKQHDMVALCLKHQVDPNNSWGRCVEQAVENDDMSMLVMLLAHGGLATYGLHEAASKNNVAMLRFLLSQGADPMYNNSIALQRACLYDHAEAFHLLYPLSDPVAALRDMRNCNFDDADCHLLDIHVQAQQQHHILQQVVATDHHQERGQGAVTRSRRM